MITGSLNSAPVLQRSMFNPLQVLTLPLGYLSSAPHCRNRVILQKQSLRLLVA